MDEKSSPQWRPEPGPSNALERLLQKAQDPAVHGRMMRALWDTELHTLIAYHPELEGEMELQNGSPIPQFIHLEDGKGGSFIPVFTSEVVAEYALAKNAKKLGKQSLASMPGEGFFQIVNHLKCHVVVNPGMKLSLKLHPEAIAALVSGELRHTRPTHDSTQKTTLRAIEYSSLPTHLSDSIRRFCDKNRVPIAVYAFVACDPATDQPNMQELRILLRLRSEDNDFYNDFRLMVGKLATSKFRIITGVILETDKSGLTWLSQQKPLWPVIQL